MFGYIPGMEWWGGIHLVYRSSFIFSILFFRISASWCTNLSGRKSEDSKRLCLRVKRPRLGSLLLFHRFKHLLESFGVVHRELGEDLSVEGDIGLLESGDELRVGAAFFLKEGRHADVPEATEVTLFVSSMSEGVTASMEDGFVGLTLFLGSSETVAFYLSKDILSGFEGINPFLDSRHAGLFNIHEETGSFLHRHVEFVVPVFSSFGSPSFLGVEVVLAGFPGQKLATFRDLDALTIGFIGFHRHIIAVVYTTDLRPVCPVLV